MVDGSPDGAGQLQHVACDRVDTALFHRKFALCDLTPRSNWCMGCYRKLLRWREAGGTLGCTHDQLGALC